MGRIRLKNEKKGFSDVTAIPPLNLENEDGEFVVFVCRRGAESPLFFGYCRAGRHHCRDYRDRWAGCDGLASCQPA